jgi:Amt family ammonium transporter
MAIGQWVMTGVSVLLLRVLVGICLSGLSRSKNAVSSIYRAMLETSTAILAFWLPGFLLAYHLGDPMAICLGACCILAASLSLAPTLERSRLAVSIIGPIVSAGIITPICLVLADSAWFTRHGFLDIAGSSWLFFSAGCMGAAAALILGPRIGKYNRDGSTNLVLGHNATLASATIFFMFILWVPFVAGSELLHGSTSTLAAAAAGNTLLSGASAAVIAMLISQIRHHKQDIFLVYSGLLGGLVSICGAAGHVAPIHAALIGAFAGILVPWLEVRIDLTLKIDDPSSWIAICLGGGAWGTLATAIFASDSMADRAHHLATQALALAIIAAISFLSFAILMLILRATVGIRVREVQEHDGMDLTNHDLNAYPDFQQTMIKSYDLRQM